MEELAAILSDEDHPERESILDLIFYPEESIQEQIENILEQFDFQRKDENTITDILLNRLPVIHIIFPDQRGNLFIKTPREAICWFLSRLNIWKKIDQKLIDAINAYVDEDFRSRFKIRLRNDSFSPNREKIEFLSLFFEKMKPASDRDHLKFILDFFGEIQNNDDIFKALQNKKERCLSNLDRAAMLEDRLNKNNIETLILQGVRIFSIDKAAMINMVIQIDDILFAVFGRH